MENNQKITRSNIGSHLFDYQLSLVGKTRVDTINDSNWRFNITITRSQHEQFRKYSIKLMMKTFRFNKTKAIANFEWFNSMFGLRIKGI